MADAAPTPPEGGAKITIDSGKLQVPDNPIVPFIEGDGTGPDIWRATVRVLDAAVAADMQFVTGIDADHAEILDRGLGTIARTAGNCKLELVRHPRPPGQLLQFHAETG